MNATQCRQWLTVVLALAMIAGWMLVHLREAWPEIVVPTSVIALFGLTELHGWVMRRGER